MHSVLLILPTCVTLWGRKFLSNQLRPLLFVIFLIILEVVESEAKLARKIYSRDVKNYFKEFGSSMHTEILF